MSNSDEIKRYLLPDHYIREYAIYAIKGEREYESVSYIFPTFSSGTVCGLCNNATIFYGTFDGQIKQRTALEAHVASLQHQVRYFQLVQVHKECVREAKIKRLGECEDMRVRTAQLGLLQWRSQLNHLTVEFIDAPLPMNGSERPTEEQRRKDALVAQLEKYEKMERLSLLELAVLKNRRCFCPDCTARHEGVSREVRLVKSGAAVIIPLVKEFLGY